MMVYAPNYEKMFNPENHLYFALDDKNPRGMELVDYDLLAHYNFEEFGVFQTIHNFKTTERKSNNVKEILFWAIDIDEGSKQQMVSKINKGLEPSYIVETKKGYHVYWKAISASIENYAEIMKGLISYYNADKQAKDLARILRVAGYNHWKTDKPFLCKECFYSNIEYSEEKMSNWIDRNVIKPKNFNNNLYLERKVSNNNDIIRPKKEIYEGSRNGFLNWYGYKLKKENNITGDTLESILLEYNQNYLKPPLSEREVLSIVGSIKNA